MIAALSLLWLVGEVPMLVPLQGPSIWWPISVSKQVSVCSVVDYPKCSVNDTGIHLQRKMPTGDHRYLVNPISIEEPPLPTRGAVWNWIYDYRVGKRFESPARDIRRIEREVLIGLGNVVNHVRNDVQSYVVRGAVSDVHVENVHRNSGVARYIEGGTFSDWRNDGTIGQNSGVAGLSESQAKNNQSTDPDDGGHCGEPVEIPGLPYLRGPIYPLCGVVIFCVGDWVCFRGLRKGPQAFLSLGWVLMGAGAGAVFLWALPLISGWASWGLSLCH